MDIASSLSSLFAGICVRPVTAEIVATGAVLVVMLFLSGFTSGSEIAMFSLGPQEKKRMEDSGKPNDAMVLRLLDDPKRLLATILIANNSINIFIVLLSAYFSEALIDFGDAKVVQFVFETIIITALILFFGEIMPKIFSQQHRISFARTAAYPLRVAEKLFSPFSTVLMRSTSVLNAKLSKHQKAMSQDDLEQALDLTSGQMTDEKDMLEDIVKFMDLEVCDIMTPRVDVESIRYSADFGEVMRTVVSTGYSRLPVIGETPDDVKGIVYVKDILRDLGKGADHDWHPTIRNCFFVPETKRVNDLLAEFQSTKTHMAIIVDEYGCMQGIVTLEDIIEEVVGDISDEQDEEDAKDWYRQPDGSYIFEGKISLNDMCKVLDIDATTFEKSRGDAATLAGLLLEKTGVIPKKKDIVEIGKYKFEVLSADQRKINKIKLVVKHEARKQP